MKITNRPTLVGALVGALALGASIDVATAQYTQDSSRVSQPGQGGVTDTANPSSRNYPTTSQDTSMTGQTGRKNPGQDTSSMGRNRAGDTTSMPKMPQQGGATDTSGYTKFKSEMGPAKDTLSAAGKTTNYQQKKQYPSNPSVVDTTPGAAGRAGTQDTSMQRTQDTSMQRQQTGATSDTGMKKSKSKSQKKSATTDTGAVGQQQHKGGMTHDTTRATPDTSH